MIETTFKLNLINSIIQNNISKDDLYKPMFRGGGGKKKEPINTEK